MTIYCLRGSDAGSLGYMGAKMRITNSAKRRPAKDVHGIVMKCWKPTISSIEATYVHRLQRLIRSTSVEMLEKERGGGRRDWEEAHQSAPAAMQYIKDNGFPHPTRPRVGKKEGTRARRLTVSNNLMLLYGFDGEQYTQLIFC